MGSAITTANCVYVPCLGNTALHWAFQHGQAELAYVLVRAHGADVNILNSQGCPPIHMAIQTGHYFMLELMWMSHSWPPAFYGRNQADLLHACGATVNETALNMKDCRIALLFTTLWLPELWSRILRSTMTILRWWM